MHRCFKMGLFTFCKNFLRKIVNLQGSCRILNTFFKDFSRTFPGQFLTFSRTSHNCKSLNGAEGTTKIQLGVCGRFEPHFGSRAEPWRGPGAKVPEAPEIPYFIVPENRLKIHILPLCCSTKTQDKVIKIATQC